MAYAASASQGATFKIGSPLVTVPGVLDIPAITEEKLEIDVTAIDDTDEQFITDPLTKRTPFTLNVAYDADNTQHMALVSAWTDRTTVAGQFTSGAGAILTGSFLVLKMEDQGGKGQASRIVFTIRPTGTIVRS